MVEDRISCTVDELAEALAAVIPGVIGLVGANRVARHLADHLNADRMPEPAIDTDEDWIYE